MKECEGPFLGELKYNGANLARQRCSRYSKIKTTQTNFTAALKSRATAQRVKEYAMGNNKNPNQKQPDEKEPGKFHYNPGNMSGKTASTKNDESEPSPTDNARRRPDSQNK
jgi:hypothetical protein